MNFFSLARHDPLEDESEDVFGYGEYDKFDVSLIKEETHRPMFDQDPGDPILRSTVYFYKLTRSMCNP